MTGPTGTIRVVRAVHAEWVKFRTLPSQPTAVAVASGMIVALAAILLSVRADERVARAPGPTELLAGVSWAQLVLVVLAVVTICSEWSSGTGKVTFLAVPARWPVLAGKVAVVGGAGLVAGVAGSAGALALASAAGADLAAPPALTARLVVGAGLYLGTIAVLALAIAAIIRDLAASILTVAGFLWVVPFVVAMVPVPAVQDLAPYLPTSAGVLLIAPDQAASALTPSAGYAVLLTWTTAALAAAAASLRTRDV